MYVPFRISDRLGERKRSAHVVHSDEEEGEEDPTNLKVNEDRGGSNKIWRRFDEGRRLDEDWGGGGGGGGG